jgi:hypothetical protein
MLYIAMSIVRAEGHADKHLFLLTIWLLLGNATGRADQGGAVPRYNEDPTQRPLGGRWNDDFSRDRSRGSGGMSPYDDPLGGRLKYDDDDEDGQVQTVQDFSTHFRYYAGTPEGVLQPFRMHHGRCWLCSRCADLLSCHGAGSRAIGHRHPCAITQYPLGGCCDGRHAAHLWCVSCDKAHQRTLSGACSNNLQC